MGSRILLDVIWGQKKFFTAFEYNPSLIESPHSLWLWDWQDRSSWCITFTIFIIKFYHEPLCLLFWVINTAILSVSALFFLCPISAFLPVCDTITACILSDLNDILVFSVLLIFLKSLDWLSEKIRRIWIISLGLKEKTLRKKGKKSVLLEQPILF